MQNSLQIYKKNHLKLKKNTIEMNQFRETTVNIMAILNYDELQTKVWHYKTAVYYQNTLTIRRFFDK